MRRSSFVAPADRVHIVPDARSWRTKIDGERAPKGPAAWSAASSVRSDRAVVDAGPNGVIDLAVVEAVIDAPGPKPQLGVVWWDKGSLREEDYEDGTIQTGFVPASLTDHVSLPGTSGSAGSPSARSAAPPVAVPVSEADLRPRQAGDHASLSEQPGGAASGPALEPTVRESRRSGRERSPGSRRHARRARHVELAPKTRGRRGLLTSHPRRTRLRRRRSRRRAVLSAILVIVAFVVTLLVQNLMMTPFTVPSSSMENTLRTGDRILVDKFAYSADPIRRGDVVVFEDPGGWLAGSQETPSADGRGYLVKRVVGIPGDHVSCCSAGGRLTVNGTEVYEPYAVVPEGQPASVPFDVTVPAGALWVLGDNRYNSRDSSQTQHQPTKGFVPIADVVGNAVLKLWPLDRFAPVASSPELASIPAQTCPT